MGAELMRREWLRRRPLAELGEIVTGTTPPSSEPDLFGHVHPFLTPSDMAYDARHVATERFLSGNGVSRFESRILPAGSVSFVCIGATIGKVAMTQVATLTNQQINSIVVDRENHHPDFVYYLLRQYAPEIRQHAGGAATPILNKTAFSQIELPIPPLPVQRKIAAVLAAYDELIENNLRRIEILEEMAQAVYREWFVNFRFPGHEDIALVDSLLGPIPEGWELVSLDALADASRGLVMVARPGGNRRAGDTCPYYPEYRLIIVSPDDATAFARCVARSTARFSLDRGRRPDDWLEREPERVRSDGRRSCRDMRDTRRVLIEHPWHVGRD